ncbi:MAG: biotin-dependent carboxyltransferase family protein [Alcanivoracaceae bacterium]|nr:biotin-dependent carboxyltransferase family protein [Alcanivoracaceae bacterium]
MIEVLSAGLYSTIQDRGRFGYRNIGVPTSGAMDRYSARLANALLNNHEDSAVMEMTYNGSILKFNKDTFVAIAGAYCPIRLNEEVVKLNSVMAINRGSILKIGRISNGVRTYMAVAGGFDCPRVLQSRSFYQGITQVSQIQKGDRLNVMDQGVLIINRSSIKTDNGHFNNNKIEVSNGPEFKMLDEKVKRNLFVQAFKISPQSNRMAYKLDVDNYLKRAFRAKEIITSSVQAGTVQFTPSGELIVLMRDCQTTGGYARVLQLTDNSINRLSQKAPGELIHLVSV